ncbi:peptidoglycan DD-metalloendopeptidase family protein [Campylobacter sp. RM16192]|uniref:peptidoglycan DD-metalloendopeptidase family protein n=1 Tax=Campylobacter sp. RM16192 TaxID=1660080 RepID=UPI0014524081|nr:peptidoglycan DD-metalloendopeptidase family protein [Campylobacter sp. RM16192]QCD52333.1 zinc metallopeptidase, M23 family [Campylobacter sp. RM16192]
MVKKIFILTTFFLQLFATKPSVEELIWPNGATFLTFLESNSIPLSIYYNLDREDKEAVSEIMAGVRYQILRDKDSSIKQVLIPINEELQIQIYKDEHDKFKVQLTPISYQVEDMVLSIKVNVSPYQDILDHTGSVALANAFSIAMNGQVDFRRIKKDDRLIIVYTQKRRLGRVFGMPEIHSAMIEVNKKQHFVYRMENKFYDKSGKQNDKFFLIRPIANARITSRFTLKRYHPVLKRYKAHLGVDYGAPKGTPIKSAGDGTVKFVGRKGGYGKVIIVRHSGGYETLYAHLNGFAKGIKSGLKVKQNQLVAYVGNTGMSTGPHLHFGLYKNQKAINPESMLKIKKSSVDSSVNAEFKKIMAENDSKIKKYLDKELTSEKEESFDNFVEF